MPAKKSQWETQTGKPPPDGMNDFGRKGKPGAKKSATPLEERHAKQHEPVSTFEDFEAEERQRGRR